MPKIHGLNKTTLLDYPGRIAATIFLGHCNFRCPFCQNSALVLNPAAEPEIPEEQGVRESLKVSVSPAANQRFLLTLKTLYRKSTISVILSSLTQMARIRKF